MFAGVSRYKIFARYQPSINMILQEKLSCKDYKAPLDYQKLCELGRRI